MENQNLRSCVRVGPKGELRNWVQLNSLNQPWRSSIDLEEQILVYKGEIPEFLLMNKQKLTNDDGDFDGAEKLEVPYNFLGYIQTLCYVRI